MTEPNLSDPELAPGAGLAPPAFWIPEYLVDSAWHEHAPFAFWVVATHRPRVLVELGTHHGFSYMAFCQAVERLDVGTKCYAVDTWQGDEHAGFYGEKVFEQLSSDHDSRYRSFSTLLRTTFSEAVRHFEDGSIDLLHIDGAHHLDDVTEDFTTWLPKMSERGVILFHDINVHRDDFGVYALWNRIKGAYPHFSFGHGHGLGVLGVGPESTRTLGSLFVAEDSSRGDEIRREFARLGAGIADRAAVEGGDRARAEAREAQLQAVEYRDQLLAVNTWAAELNTRNSSLESHVRDQRQHITAISKDLEVARERIAALQSSTSWRVTAPLRGAKRAVAPLFRFVKRGLKVMWWTATLQLPRRLRAYRAYRSPADSAHTTSTVTSERMRSSSRGPHFEEFEPPLLPADPRATLIAMYLTQYHAIPENDEWWGTGFTEWTNLGRGTPRFVGHYQPRTPRDLGFYDLTNTDVMRRQIEMARAAGIGAFCFYYYRFPEGRLLERPVEAFLADPTLQMPFCLMWANENWTRTWDGSDQQILRRQVYTPELEDELMADFIRHIADPRYLRIDGRPLLLIYRPHLIPDPGITFARWRRRIQDATGDEPILLMAQSFGDVDPRPYRLDGAIEFPPHKYGGLLRDIRGDLEMLDPDHSGNVYSYDDLVRAAGDQEPAPFPLFRTVVPSWDNESRRPGRGLTLAGSTPLAYQRWLEESIDHAQQNPLLGRPVVFINAWNEWTEGAYLEPDVHFGAAYLNATARALKARPYSRHRYRVLLVGHDALPRGAQRLLLDLGRALGGRFGFEVEFLLLAGGEMIDRYREVAPVRVLPPEGPALDAYLDDLASRGFAHAITNTVVTGPAVPRLKEHGFVVVSLVHEMDSFIEDRGWTEGARTVAEAADRVVVAAPLVGERLSRLAPVASDRLVVQPQGLYVNPIPAEQTAEVRAAMRAEWGIAATSRVVLGVGHADLRKGFDLFAAAADEARSLAPHLTFVWVGGGERDLLHWIEARPEGERTNLRVIDRAEDIARWYATGDALFLSSREDAFPSTVLEAMSAGMPVVGFAGCTGTGDLIARFGLLVDPFDVGAAVRALDAVIANHTQQSAEESRRTVRDDHAFDDYAFRLVEMLFPGIPRVSVVVPTFQYGRFLSKRLLSIFNQTHPIFEVLVLDDASTDDTMEVLNDLKRHAGREFSIVRREQNSGSIWLQWRDGARLARGSHLWIAEADDLTQPGFLGRVVAAFTTNGSPPVLAFSDSAQIDAAGNAIGDSYLPYLREGTGSLFTADFRMSGALFRSQHLMVRNPILNTSSVIFRRDVLLEVVERNLEDLLKLRFAGDWLVYAELCSIGDVAFVADPLNTHRRHVGATFGSRADDHVAEIGRVHDMLRARFGSSPDLIAAQTAYRQQMRDYLHGLAGTSAGT